MVDQRLAEWNIARMSEPRIHFPYLERTPGASFATGENSYQYSRAIHQPLQLEFLLQKLGEVIQHLRMSRSFRQISFSRVRLLATPLHKSGCLLTRIWGKWAGGPFKSDFGVAMFRFLQLCHPRPEEIIRLR